MTHSPISTTEEFVTDDFGIIRLRKQHHLTDPAFTLANATNDNRIVRLSRSSFMDFDQFHQALPWHQHLMATAANAGDSQQAVIVGHSAALWHGLWIYDHSPSEVELHRCPATRAFDTGIRHYDTPVGADEETVVDGLAVTTVARTIVDIYRMHGPGAAFVTMCSALKLKACSTEDVREVAEKTNWRRIKGLKVVLEHATDAHTSPLEAIAHAQVTFTQFADLAPTYANGVFTTAGNTTFTVDNTSCPLQHQAEAQNPDLTATTPTVNTNHTVATAQSLTSGTFLHDLLEPHIEEDFKVGTLADHVNAELANMFF